MTDVDAIVAGLSGAEKRAVAVMKSYECSDTPCYNARHLAEQMGQGYSPDDARMAARKLVSLNLAEVETGLMTADGDLYGSGWHLVKTGLAVRAKLEADNG